MRNPSLQDLRATTATWYAVRGDPPLKIQRHLGHASLETTQLCIREAENLTIPSDSVFPNLPMGLLAAETDADKESDKPHKVDSRSPEKTLVKP